MAIRGGKPHPTWRRRLDGNPGKRPYNEREPDLQQPAPAFDQVPTEIAGNAVAAGEWTRVAPLLRAARQITDADRASLLALCLEWSRYILATGKLATDGMLIETPNGYPMPSPYVGIARSALTACGRLWAELGMTPSSRSRVKTVRSNEPDAFAEFDAPLGPASNARPAS